ncbi:hypothetical protein BGZ63DRAFT_467855 [Mariannaea sp. PMI_226]|nr:hypothetical protein BGZ63DRAFT_467855 [Mariannaea sp. PMI_226]
MVFLQLRGAASCGLVKIIFSYGLFTLFSAQVLGLAISKPILDDLATTNRYPAINARADDIGSIIARDGPTLADIPSLDQLRQAVKAQSKFLASLINVDPDDLTTIFYTSNPLPIDEIECFANKFIGEGKFIYFENAISEDDAHKFELSLLGNAQAKDLYQKQLSRVIAEQADGEVMLLIPPGVEPSPQSTWTLYEFPALQHDNRNNVEVYRVDVTGSTEAELIWETENGPTLPPPLDTLPPGN